MCGAATVALEPEIAQHEVAGTSRVRPCRYSIRSSCIGQQLSVYGPAFGADLGAAVSCEARHPEVFGTPNLGDGRASRRARRGMRVPSIDETVRAEADQA